MEDLRHHGFGAVYVRVCGRLRGRLALLRRVFAVSRAACYHCGIWAVAGPRAHTCPLPLRPMGRGSIRCSAIPAPGTPFFLG